MEIKPVKIEAEIQWAFLNKKSEMSDRYQVDLTNLSEKAVAALEAVGIKPLNRDDKPEKGWYITVKSTNEIKAFDSNLMFIALKSPSSIPKDCLFSEEGNKLTEAC